MKLCDSAEIQMVVLIYLTIYVILRISSICEHCDCDGLMFITAENRIAEIIHSSSSARSYKVSVFFGDMYLGAEV
jgi:hypothetical protein